MTNLGQSLNNHKNRAIKLEIPSTAPTLHLVGEVEGIALALQTAEVLAFVILYVEDRHYPPSYKEIMQANKLASPGVVQYHLNHLRKVGVLDWDRSQSRTLRVLRPVQLQFRGAPPYPSEINA